MRLVGWVRWIPYMGGPIDGLTDRPIHHTPPNPSMYTPTYLHPVAEPLDEHRTVPRPGAFLELEGSVELPVLLFCIVGGWVGAWDG